MSDEIAETIDWMIESGYLEYHPDDAGKPEGDRRLRITPKGEAHRDRIAAFDRQRAQAHLS